MRDLIRLLVIILLLPLIIIFIGPFLMLAAVRGRQWMGPVTLNSSQYNALGRMGMFLLGSVIWVWVWGGLLWLVVGVSPFTVSRLPLADTITALQKSMLASATSVGTSAPSSSTPTPDSTFTRTATPLPPSPSATNTPTAATFTPTKKPTVPSTATALPTALATVTAANTATAVPTPTATATTTPTKLWPTTTPTAKPEATQTPVTTVTVTPVNRTPSPQPRGKPASINKQAVMAAVDRANVLLQKAIIGGDSDDEEHLENLEAAWQGNALTMITEFALEINARYAQPFNVEFEYVTPPTLSNQSVSSQVVVFSEEKWTYGGPTNSKEEIFEFIYTLIPRNNGWVITRYTYRNLPLQTSTPIITVTSKTSVATADLAEN